MIEDEIENVTVDTSVITFSKPSKFSRADCGYVVAPNFSSSRESVEFFYYGSSCYSECSFF